MLNFIIIGILALLAGLAVAGIVRNRKNGSGCCGGGCSGTCGSCPGCGVRK